ncbi:hypothetical protein [Phenylobacterium ferrooxidans]|uniref:Uncharacterized protein n=1 Tax=Phenylobacterium ferrooxidans TaxID=2982689 RepID=A0ABW6CN76_9CAUL
MSSIEIRVRPVTRYQITIHETTGPDASGRGRSSTIQFGEFDSLEVANRIGRMQADVEREAYAEESSINVSFHGVDQKPGVVMRCKVSLYDRMVNVASAVDADGKCLGKKIQRGEGANSYEAPDPQDPANWRPDGEKLRFAAVMAGFSADGVANVEENRIFGHWSPSFNLEAVVRNEHVLQELEQGAEYYVDFTPAPKTIAPS